MKTVAVVNYKGGVGKTTFVANIAAKLAMEGKKVLLVDLDPQGSLTFSFMHVDEWEKRYSNNKTIKSWFNNKLNNKSTSIRDYIISDLCVNKNPKIKEPISIISSHLGLFDISLEMPLKLSGWTKRTFYRNNINCLFMLKEGLSELKDSYDYVFLDCQPSFDLITQNAIVACDYYLIPTKLDNLSTLGIDSLLFHIKELVNELNESVKRFNFNDYNLNPKLLGVAGNMVTIVKNGEKTTFNKNIENKFLNPKYKLFKHSIRNNSEFMDMEDLIPAVVKNPDTKTRKEISKEIEEVILEFEEKINGR